LPPAKVVTTPAGVKSRTRLLFVSATYTSALAPAPATATPVGREKRAFEPIPLLGMGEFWAAVRVLGCGFGARSPEPLSLRKTYSANPVVAVENEPAAAGDALPLMFTARTRIAPLSAT